MGKATRIQRTRKEIAATRFDLDDYEAPTLVKRDEPEPEDDRVEMIVAFTIGDKPYYARTSVPFKDTVDAFRIAATGNEAGAVAFQLQTVLGMDGYNALMGFDGIGPDDFQKIVVLANRIFTASSQGKSR